MAGRREFRNRKLAPHGHRRRETRVVWTWAWGLPAAASGFTLAWQCVAAVRFPLHRPLPAPRHFPSITLLKPLKGADEYTEPCLRSWLEQDYGGRVQVLFGVRDPTDPVVAVVNGLLHSHPGLDARLVVCSRDLGPNAKVTTLAQLEPMATGDIVVVSDADVRAPRDVLTQIAAHLEDPGVELVNFLYRLATPATWAMHWEAAAVNADFWSQVLQACSMAPQDFALGAVMAVRRSRLEALGGLKALADYLADDFQLGRRVARAGGKLALSRRVVECWEGPSGWGRVWAHQTRWARTLRACEGAKYFASIIANPTLWWLVWLLGSRPGWGVALPLLALRMAIAGGLARRLGRMSERPGGGMSAALWAPWRDLLGAAVWASAFLGRRVHWRGEMFDVARDGRLTPLKKRSV
jgi:ceramide glucosyltransferase